MKNKLFTVVFFIVVFGFVAPSISLAQEYDYYHKGEKVANNWGFGNPEGISKVDYFTALFDQSRVLKKGDYFIQTTADNGVRVEVDGNLKINRWTDTYDSIERATLLDAAEKFYSIKTEYYEKDGGAAVFSDVVPFGNWLAYYYSNENLKGSPQASKIISATGGQISLNENFGTSAPAAGVPQDHFSARYTTAQHIKAGDYVIRTNLDDKIRVLIDGKTVVDRWDYVEEAVKITISDRNVANAKEKDVHWIEVQYTDIDGAGKAELTMQKLEDVLKTDDWTGFFYKNTAMAGDPIVLGGAGSGNTIEKIGFNWGFGTPHKMIPSDRFSALFTKNIQLAGGDYFIQTTADNGVRVQVDGATKINRWNNNYETIERSLLLGASAGKHKTEVHYYDDVFGAAIYADVVPLGNWLAYYYANEYVLGSPQASKIIPASGGKTAFNEQFGTAAPAAGVPNDHFSARYATAQRIKAGDYVIRTNIDDKIRVLIDGKTVVDRQAYSEEAIKITIADRQVANANEKDVHWIEVQYADIDGNARVDFSLQPYSEIFQTNQWVGLLYPNMNMAGNPVVLGGAGSDINIERLTFHWGFGTPHQSIPVDRFSAEFTKKVHLDAGDYFLQTTADNGVRVEVDGNEKISRWTDTYDSIERAVLLNAAEKDYTLKTQYYELDGGAALYSDILPFNTWLAYYYPNEGLNGSPVASKTIQPSGDQKRLKEDHGTGSPAAGVPRDHFSARYTTAMRLNAGEYVIRTKTDDKIRVLIDGKTVVDRWDYDDEAIKISIADRNVANPDEKNVHFIEVHYTDINGAGNVDFFLQPYNEIYTTDQWVGEIYPSSNFTGNPAILGGAGARNQIEKLNFNWGSASPTNAIPQDHFTARFMKKAYFSAGTYVFDPRADDGVRVSVDGKVVVDNWSGNYGAIDKKPIYLATGVHEVKVEYLEKDQNAYLSLDYEQISIYNIYYVFGKEVSYNWGYDSPGPEFPKDHFEALFDQLNWYQKGDYFIQTTADNGVKVEIDGKVKLERWNNQFDTIDRALWHNDQEGQHTVRTHYYDDVYGAAVFANVVPFNSWLAYYYPNENLVGSPVASIVLSPVGENGGLVENIGNGSPDSRVPADHFSARYVTAKRLPAGHYAINMKADDGIRVLIDGQVVFDGWQNGPKAVSNVVTVKDRNDAPANERDVHWVEIQYYEYDLAGNVEFYMEKVQQAKVIEYTSYNYSLADILAAQMNVQPQTSNHYDAYIFADALRIDPNNPNIGTVEGIGWNVRGGPGTNYWILGKVNNGERVTILGQNQLWYQIKYDRYWVNASPSDVQYYLDPNNFPADSNAYFQFLRLSELAGVNAGEVNQKILNNKGTLTNKAQSFIDAAEAYHVNEIYLISHSLLETGNGNSRLANGILVKTVDGKPTVLTNDQGIPLTVRDVGSIPEGAKAVYNMYGVGANDSNPEINGAIYAYNAGWFTPETAIFGGAQFIGDGYVNAGQDTLYKMRWNPANPASHQYATDIGWAVKQTNSIASLYGLLYNYVLRFDVPKYR